MVSHHLESAFEFVSIPENVVASFFLFVVDTNHDISPGLGHLTTEFRHFSDHFAVKLYLSLKLVADKVSLVNLGQYLTELRFKLRELGLLSLDVSLFSADAVFSVSSFLLLVEALLLELEFHLSLHASLSLFSIFLGISVRLFTRGFSLKSFNLSLELSFHIRTLFVLSGLLSFHLHSELIKFLLGLSLK
jgi:hypothetical protein